MMTKFEEITNARETLQLPERASLETIREQYKTLLNKWHPDKCNENSVQCHEMTRDIIQAYNLILSYCHHVEFTFTEEEISKSCSAEEWWFKRFGNSPWW